MSHNVVSPSFGLKFVGTESLPDVLEALRERILGIVAYGATRPSPDVGHCPFVWVEMPVIGADLWYEVWVSGHAVTTRHDGRLQISCDGDTLFGSCTLDEDGQDRLEADTHRAYAEIFDAIDREGYPYLQKVWNYFSGINEAEQGLERYRAFSVGRHEAFRDKGREIVEGSVPAACALGSYRGSQVIYFIAQKVPGLALENPRQTSAYAYPREFGPRSPTFSRAMLVGPVLFVSGTASILGHETVHPHDLLRQLDETVANLRAILQEASAHGFSASGTAGLFFKVYLRHAQDYPEVQARIAAEFGAAHSMYLQADVCRSDLMVEIELSWLP